MKYIKLFEDINIFNEKEFFQSEYINYTGYLPNTPNYEFDKLWLNIQKDFKYSGFSNIPNEIHLSRLIYLNNDLKLNNHYHWIRSTDDYLFHDPDWLFLTNIKVTDKTKILEIKTNKYNIDFKKSIIQNLTFPYEKEITLNNGFTLTNYDIIDY